MGKGFKLNSQYKDLLKELVYRNVKIGFVNPSINIPSSFSGYIADYALLASENKYLNFNNKVIDMLSDIKMVIVFSLGDMVNKVKDARPGEAKSFWISKIKDIHEANSQLTTIEQYFYENESVYRRMSKDYFNLLEAANKLKDLNMKLEEENLRLKQEVLENC